MKYEFDDYEVCVHTRELLHNGQAVKIEPLVFKLLIFMLENPDRVLSHDELINAVWKSTAISKSALNATVCAVRYAIGDSGSIQKYIKTVSGSGYRFVAKFTCTCNGIVNDGACFELPQRRGTDIDRVKEGADAQYSSLACCCKLSSEMLVLPDKPSIAVMHFVDMSASQEGALLACGLTVDVNTSLSKLDNFFVIARASVASLERLELSPKEISRRLGVRYLVYGNTQRILKRIRVTVSIVDAISSNEIWSEHFDRSLDDFFQVQDEITHGVVAAIDVKVEWAEIERAFLVPPDDLNAWEYYHQGLWYMNQTTEKGIGMAQQLFQQAISLDSMFSRAYAGLSYTYSSCAILSVAPSVSGNLSEALVNAQRSIDCRRPDLMGYIALGRALLLLKEHEQASKACDQALQHQPNYALGHFVKVIICGYSGFDKQAQWHYDTALRLNPFDPMKCTINAALAVSQVNQGAFDKAADLILCAANNPNAYLRIHALTAACLELAGRKNEAKNLSDKILKHQPNYSTEIYRRILSHKDESINDMFQQAMLSAGLPGSGCKN